MSVRQALASWLRRRLSAGGPRLLGVAISSCTADCQHTRQLSCFQDMGFCVVGPVSSAMGLWLDVLHVS